MGRLIGHHDGIAIHGRANLLDDLRLRIADQGGGLRLTLRLEDRSLALGTRLRYGRLRFAVRLGNANRCLRGGLHLLLLAFVTNLHDGVLGADRIVLRLNGRLHRGLEAGAVGDAAQLQINKLNTEDAVQSFADALADLTSDLLSIRRNAHRVLRGEHTKHAVSENRAYVLRDVDVAATADAIEKLQHRRWRDLIGEPDVDVHGLVVHSVNGQVGKLKRIEARLDGVDGIDERRLEVQAGADRLCRYDGAEASNGRHFCRLNRVEASERGSD